MLLLLLMMMLLALHIMCFTRICIICHWRWINSKMASVATTPSGGRGMLQRRWLKSRTRLINVISALLSSFHRLCWNDCCCCCCCSSWLPATVARHKHSARSYIICFALLLVDWLFSRQRTSAHKHTYTHTHANVHTYTIAYMSIVMCK